MTITSEKFSPLQTVLEEQFEQLTEELTRLTMHATTPEVIGYDQHGLEAQIAATRQKLAETTQALQRIASGTYGLCERCHKEIPPERLEIRPHARYCVPCQQVVGA
jgi:DnaK suppressor protein